MRWAVLPLLVVVLGCGRSDEEFNNAINAERAAAAQRLSDQQNQQNAAMEARACADREARMLSEHRDAMARNKQTILTTLEAVSNSMGDGEVNSALEFGVTIEALTPTEWRWVEVENSAAVSTAEHGSVRDRINYSVNPALLSTRVQLVTYAGLPAVRIDCTSGNCIRAIGRRLAHYNGSDALQDIDERRAYNIWALGTANRAEVVRDALTDLIGRGRNPPRAGGCGGAAESNMQ